MVVPFPCLRDRMEGGEIGAWGHPWGHPMYDRLLFGVVHGPSAVHDRRPRKGRGGRRDGLEGPSAA
jgi:hypothetical protein